MGRQLDSWDDLGGSSGAEFAKSWKKEGFYKAILHRSPPSERRVHNFRRIEIDENAQGGPKKTILWFPFVCHEDENYHRLKRMAAKSKETAPKAQQCPACRFIEHLEEQDDLADDVVVFTFLAGQDRRDLLKVDVLGLGDTKRSFQDNLVGKTEYIIPHIPVDDPTQVLVTAEKWSMGMAIKKRIKDDRKIYGTDEDPAKKPIAYIFEYDSETQKYGCSRLDNYEVPESVEELWAGPAPDSSRFISPGNPQTLYDQMKGGAEVASFECPFDDIFDPALKEWRHADEDDPALVFPPPDDETDVKEESPVERAKAKAAKAKEAKAAKAKEAKAAKAKEAKEAKAAKAKAAKTNGASEPAPEEKAEAAPKKQRKTRKTKKDDPPPAPPNPEVEVFECPDCSKDWPENLAACPNPECNAVADEPVDEPQTAAQAAQSGAKKGIPWG